MKTNRVVQPVLALIVTATFIAWQGCRKAEENVKITFYFHHVVSDSILAKDDLRYVNIAGNRYEVDELQYFVSDLALWKGGNKTLISAENGIHYVDIDIPSSLSWNPDQKIEAATYDSVSFVFGISADKNKSGLFVNPPQRDMFWPEMMGGGYHYMKMNGKWLNTSGILEAFNFHLGIGMQDDGQGNMQFVHNCFTVSFPLKDCEIAANMINPGFIITMDINSWFQTPVTWDWDEIGGHIMQNQDAMHKAALNGKDAFSVQYTGFHPE